MNKPPIRDAASSPASRTRLLSAAGPIFASHGFDRATVRDICTAADVNIASVGYYFGDKLGLYREVIQQIREAREQRFPTPSQENVDPRIALYGIVRTMLSRMLAGDQSGWESQLMMREMQSPTPVFLEMFNEYFRPLFDRLSATIRDLTGSDPPQHVIEHLTLSTVGQCVYYRIGAPVIEMLIPNERREEHFDIESLAQHITATMLSACNNDHVTSMRSELQHLLQGANVAS